MEVRTLENTKSRMILEELQTFRENALKQEVEKRRHVRIQELIQQIPLRYQNKTFTDFKIDYEAQVVIKKTVERFVETFVERLKEGTCLTFLGKHGTGKTLLAMLIYQALIKLGYLVCYEPSLLFLRQLQEKNFESHAALQRLIGNYQKQQLLIIDEATEGFAKNSLCDWEKQMLFTLVDARYQAKLCTIVISNRSKKEMLERLGEGVIDRLSENGATLVFNWDSYRKK